MNRGRKIIRGLLALLLGAVPALVAHGDDAQDYFTSGMHKSVDDEQGAIADFTKAIALKPDYAAAYRHRGDAEMVLRKEDAALADYNKALEIDPKDVEAHLSRAGIRQVAGDWLGALEDLNKALEIQPDYPDIGAQYRRRANLLYGTQQFARAVAEYRKTGASPNVSPREFDYDQIDTWLARARLDERKEATAGLLAYMAARKPFEPGNWQEIVMRFLAGKISGADFAKSAGPRDNEEDKDDERDRRGDVLFYTGMMRLLEGDKTAAAEDFKKCVATRSGTRLENTYAKIELKLLTPEEPK